MTDNNRPWSPPQIIWSALLGILVWSAVGFSWFGYGFDWTTRINAERQAVAAVTESLATICAAQARTGPDSAVTLKKFADVDSWKEREFIETARWAIMPGSTSSENGVASLCATKLHAS